MPVTHRGLDQRPLQWLCLEQGNDVVQLLLFQMLQKCVRAKAAVTSQ
jgi:hypothetical protein